MQCAKPYMLSEWRAISVLWSPTTTNVNLAKGYTELLKRSARTYPRSHSQWLCWSQRQAAALTHGLSHLSRIENKVQITKCPHYKRAFQTHEPIGNHNRDNAAHLLQICLPTASPIPPLSIFYRLCTSRCEHLLPAGDVANRVYNKTLRCCFSF